MKNILILLLLLSLSLLANSQEKTGMVTVKVMPYCKIVVFSSTDNDMVHFNPNEDNHLRRKHVRIESSGSWSFYVRPQSRYLSKIDGGQIEVSRISYTLEGISPAGNVNFSGQYPLYTVPVNPPTGNGTVEFDVVFSLDADGLEKVKWGNYNTKIEFACSPDI